jgi:peroxiredoxin
VLGISVDSVHSHRAFAKELGGITLPLLADFHPKGEVIKAYGLWREERGDSRRAIVILDSGGIVRHVEVIPKGPPDIENVIKQVRHLAPK